MKNSQDEFIRGFLAATRLDALGTYISEQSVQLKKMLFDEILNSVLTNINIALPLRLYLCDTYDLFSRVFPVQMKGQGAVFYLLFDQHMEIINRIFNAIYLSEDDSGHDVWRLAYELFLESSMVGRNGLHSSYFGMNKLALGDYTSKKEWFSEENNFFSFVQSAFIMGHEIGHWICDVDKDERKAVNLNLKDKLSYTIQNISDMVYDIFRQYQTQFAGKDYFELIQEASASINDKIIEECAADAIAISAVLQYIESFDDEDLAQMGFGNRDLQSAALEAMLILFMNLQILAMQKMTVSPESFEIQSSIRLAFFRNYIYIHYEDMGSEFNRLLENTALRYEERITNLILESFSELEERATNLDNKLTGWNTAIDTRMLMEL